MKNLIFLEKKEANEVYRTMKEKGFKVQEPEKQPMPKGSRKVYDLNGKAIKSRWILKVSTGRGYGGAETLEEAEFEAFKRGVEAYPTEEEQTAKDVASAKYKAYAAKQSEREARAEVEAQWAERKRESHRYEERTHPEAGKWSYAEAEATAKEMRKVKARGKATKIGKLEYRPTEKRETYILKGKKPGEFRVVAGTKKELEAPRTLSAALRKAKAEEKKKYKQRKKLVEKPLRELKRAKRVVRTTSRHIKASMLHKPSSFIPLRGHHPAIGAVSMEYKRPRIASLPGKSFDITDQSISPFGS